MMKEIKNEAVYAKIEVLLEVLGHDNVSITKLMDLIKGKVQKAVKKSKSCSKPKKGQYLDSILSVMINNPAKSFTVDEIGKEIGISVPTIRTYIKQLRTAHKVKLVDWSIMSTGPATLMYQSYRNPMKALKTVTQKEGYDSVYNFVRNHKDLIGKGVLPSSFAFVVEQEGLTIYPLLLGIGVVKGYKVSELKKLAKKVYGSEEVKPKREYTKKATKVKRKYTKRVDASVDVTSMPTVAKNNFSMLGRLFRKKEASDLIKF